MDIATDPVGTMSVVSTTVTTTTASPNGYKLYLSMTGSNNDLVNTTNSALRIPSTSGTLTSPTALSAEGTWGFALSSTASKVVASGFDTTYTTGSSFAPNNNKFASIPTSDKAPQLIAESDTASAAGGDNLSVYYGVSANYGIPSGTYSNTVKYTAIADSGSGHYLYVYPNQTTSTTGGDPIAVATTLYATTNTGLTSDIPASVYMLTPSELASVHSGTNISTYSNKQLTCSRVTTSDTLAFDCTTLPADNGSYYIYVDIPTYGESYEQAFLVTAPTSFFTLTTMQQMSDYPQFCTSATTPATTAQYEDTTGAFAGNTNYVPTVILRDTRDGETYKVRKLADGNCWMVDNLRISGKTLTSADSNVVADFTLPEEVSGTQYDESYVYTDNTYGGYYSWYAATAGTGTASMTSGETTSSICPKGWRLPKGGTTGEFQDLRDNYYSASTFGDNWTLTPLEYSRNGYRDGNTMYFKGNAGRYWSSSIRGANEAYILIMSNASVGPAAYGYKYLGFGVRCLTETRTLFDIDKMQEMTPQIVKNTTTPLASATQADTDGSHKGDNTYVPQRTLTDIRDGETYRVRKLADGNVWMTENLRKELTAGEVLKPGTTDVATDTTVGLATQPYNQASTDRYGWGVEDNTSTNYNRNTVDRWLSRSTKVGNTWSTETTPVQNVSTDQKQDLTGEDQKTGVFYNWFAATAGTGTWDISTGGVEAQSSVCPAGWELPRYSRVNGGSTLAPNGSWMHLIRDIYGIIGTSQGDQGDGGVAPNKTHAFPLSLPFSGSVNWRSGGIMYQGTRGLWWSAGSTSQSSALLLYVDSTEVWPESNALRLDGFTVRCLAK